MQLHCLHANSFAVEGHSREPDIERTETSVGNCIVVFVAAETGDERQPTAVARDAATRIAEIADQLNERTVVLVPAPPLTDRPADETVSATLLQRLEQNIEYRTHAVPPGYDLAVELETRGHPFASQHVHVEPKREKERETGESEWFVVPAGSGGERHRVVVEDTVVDGSPGVTLDTRQRALLQREQSDGTTEPPVGTVFERVADGPTLFDPTADEGWLLPAGVLDSTLLLDFLRRRLVAYGAVPVQRYTGQSELSALSALDESMLRDAAFPVSVFDVRGCGVTDDGPARGTPTLSTLVSRTQDALDEVVRQAALVHNLLTSLGIEYEPVVRTSAVFAETHAEWLSQFAATFGQSLLLERRPERGKQPLAVEFVVTDATGNRLAAPSVVFADNSIREKLSAHAGETYVVHAMPLAAPVRLLAALVTQTTRQERPQLPLWLAPVHLRLIPITAEHVAPCETLAAEFEAAGIRVDIDDRDQPVSERLQAADTTWIPYDVVVGDVEADGEILGVTVRADYAEGTFTAAELRDRLRAELDGWPQAPLPLVRRHSQRAAFLETV